MHSTRWWILWCLMGLCLATLTISISFCSCHTFPKASNFCPLCQATTVGENTWCNFRPDAPWRQTLWQSHTWRAWQGRSRSPFFSLSYTSALTVCLDYLHCKYLGSDQYQFGAVFEVLVRFVLPGAPDENLERVWEAPSGGIPCTPNPPANRDIATSTSCPCLSEKDTANYEEKEEKSDTWALL